MDQNKSEAEDGSEVEIAEASPARPAAPGPSAPIRFVKYRINTTCRSAHFGSRFEEVVEGNVVEGDIIVEGDFVDGDLSFGKEWSRTLVEKSRAQVKIIGVGQV
jgi:hypothetical protein